MEFKVNSGVWGTMFGVPAIVADNFLKLASAEQIKVLLYVLRHSGNMCSDEEIAVNTGTTPAQVVDAMLFWAAGKCSLSSAGFGGWYEHSAEYNAVTCCSDGFDSAADCSWHKCAA